MSSFVVGAAELVELETRPDVRQRFVLIEPEQAHASVILFSGGRGKLELASFFGKPTIGKSKNNFLVRSRERFASHGLRVAVVDAPSDRQSKRGMLGGFRDSDEHVVDIDQVIAYLKQKSDAPVWLIGTSRGTESAAQLAIHSTQQPDGLVLTSSMSVANSKGTAVTDMALQRITVPTLIVGHVDDACHTTPPDGANVVAARLSAAAKVEVKMFSGGDKPRSKPCKAKSYHGFYGIEDQVVAYIAEFIKGD